jgi:hypothetical protein
VNDTEYFAASLALVPAGRAGDARAPGVGRAIARRHEGELARQRVRLAGLQARLAGRERELAALLCPHRGPPRGLLNDGA